MGAWYEGMIRRHDTEAWYGGMVWGGMVGSVSGVILIEGLMSKLI
jgi:hypothetical protein